MFSHHFMSLRCMPIIAFLHFQDAKLLLFLYSSKLFFSFLCFRKQKAMKL